MNVPNLECTLRENSRETDLFLAAQESIRNEIQAIQVYDGPWIDIESADPNQDTNMVLSVRMHNRGSTMVGEKNQQIRFDYYTDEFRVLIGNVFEPHCHGIPIGRDKLEQIWTSNSEDNSQAGKIQDEIRNAIADKILQVLIYITNKNTRHRFEKERVTNRKECSSEALRILYLLKQVE